MLHIPNWGSWSHYLRLRLFTSPSWQGFYFTSQVFHFQPFYLYLSGHSGCKHVPLQEIIAVNLERSLGKVSPFKSAKKNSSTPLKESPIYIELQPLHPVSFSIHVVKRCPNHKWKKKKVTFFCQGENLCRTWVEKIEEALSNPGKLNYSSSSRNFSKLVIFLPNLMNKHLCTIEEMGRKLKKIIIFTDAW